MAMQVRRQPGSDAANESGSGEEERSDASGDRTELVVPALRNGDRGDIGASGHSPAGCPEKARCSPAAGRECEGACPEEGAGSTRSQRGRAAAARKRACRPVVRGGASSAGQADSVGDKDRTAVVRSKDAGGSGEPAPRKDACVLQ